MDRTKERIYDGLRLLLAGGGPFSAVVIRYTDMNESDWNLWVQLALFVIPPVGAWVWGFYLNTIQRQAKLIASAPQDQQVDALQALSPEVKVNLAERLPDVATVVVRDSVNGRLAAMAASETNPKVVTETQNEIDAKMGTKT